MAPRLQCAAARGLRSAVNTPRIPTRSVALLYPSTLTASSPSPRHYATATASIPGLSLPADYVPPLKPPTARPADVRKAQLLRSYTSLLRSTPLILMFQHNNLTAVEWAAIRRELRKALAGVPQGTAPVDISPQISLQVIRTRIFDIALKIVEFFDPSNVKTSMVTSITGKKVPTVYNHDLSKAAYEAIKSATKEGAPESTVYAQLSPLMVGP